MEGQCKFQCVRGIAARGMKVVPYGGVLTNLQGVKVPAP